MTLLSKWSLGIASHTGDFVVVIPKGSPLPARPSVTVTTTADSQPDMKLSICIGESIKAENNYPLSNIHLEGFEKNAAAGISRVRLTFYAYEHSIVRIGVRYKEGEPQQEINIIPAANLSEEDMNWLREMVDKMTSQAQEVGNGDPGIIPLSAVV